jgi:hypothetical protein
MSDRTLVTPLEIPRLVITPSTPTDDPPKPKSGRGRGRRPNLFRSQSLLDQIETTTTPSPIPTSPASSHFGTRSPSGSGFGFGFGSRNDKKEANGYHHLTPFDSTLPAHSHPPPLAHSTRTRSGKGTAASLILVALAFVLVISSVMFSPESITGLLHSETEWMASDRVEMWVGHGVKTQQDTNTENLASGSDLITGINLHTHTYTSHYDDDLDSGDSISSTFSENDRPSRDPRTELHTETESEVEPHTTTGPVLTNDAWRSYLKRKAQVTGQAGPTAHLEAWDFH